jgi:hypothetical protein
MAIVGQFNGNKIISVPSSPGFRSIDWNATDIVGVGTNTFTGQQQVQSWQSGFLSGTVTLPAMTRQQARTWISFLLQAQGSYNVFQIGDKFCVNPLGSALGSPVTLGFGQSGYTLNTNGWDASAQGVLLAGDYVQLGYRLYRCLDDVNADGTGNASFSIWPQIRETVPSGTPLITTNTKGLFRLASNQRSWNESYIRTVGLSFHIIEAL